MPGRCVGRGRPGRGARRPRGRRWGARTPRVWGARRRARPSAWPARCASAGRLQDRQRARGRRHAAETDAAGVNGASGTPGTAGAVEAARDPRAVWVDGALGEPEVVGPAGCVWVTGSGKEADDWSPLGCERKGHLGALGHEGILGPWLKVPALRAASECGEEGRVELHSVPAGEGPVERGPPGQASWVETSQGGIARPWVKGQVRAVPGASGLSTVMGLGEGCESDSGLCGQGQAGRLPPLREPGAVEKGVHVLASGPWERGQSEGVPGALGWPEAALVSRADVEMGCGGAPGLWGRGQLVQVPGAVAQKAVCGDTPGLWERGQAVEVPDVLVVPRAVEGQTTSVGAPAIWQQRQEVDDRGSEGIPSLWGTEQRAGMPCANEAETRCGCHPEFRERGQVMWIETGSDGDPGSWGASQMAELSGSGENQISSQGASGQWGIEQALGKKGCVRIPGQWGRGQLPGISPSVVAGAVEEESSSGSALGLWEKQQDLGAPLAEAVPWLVGEETHSGTFLSLWEKSNAVGEQDGLVPAALEVPGPVDQEAGCGSVPCLYGRRQAGGVPQAAGVPVALGVVKSEKAPATVWVSGPECQSSSRDVLNLWESAGAARVPVASGGPMAPQEPWAVGEDTGPGAFPSSWGRRQAVGVPMTPEAPSPLEVQTGPRGISGFSGRKQTAGIPVIMRAFPAGGVPVGEETGSGNVSGLCRERETVGGPTDAKDSTKMGVPTSAKMLGPLGEKTGSGCTSGLLEGRQTKGMSTVVGLPEPPWEETLSEGLLGLPARRQTAGMPVTRGASVVLGMPTASGVPGPQLVGNGSSGAGSSIWGMRQAPEVPIAVKIPGPCSEGTSGLWQRRPSAAVPVAAGVSGPLGTLAAIGVPMAGCQPATVWVTGSPGKEAGVGVLGLTVVRRQSTEGAGASGVQTGDRSILGLPRRSQASVPYTSRGSARLWSCPRSGREETECSNKNVSRVSGTRVAVVVPPVSRQETEVSHFRGLPQQSARRQVGRVSEIRDGGADLGENYVEEDRSRTFQ